MISAGQSSFSNKVVCKTFALISYFEQFDNKPLAPMPLSVHNIFLSRGKFSYYDQWRRSPTEKSKQYVSPSQTLQIYCPHTRFDVFSKVLFLNRLISNWSPFFFFFFRSLYLASWPLRPQLFPGCAKKPTLKCNVCVCTEQGLLTA